MIGCACGQRMLASRDEEFASRSGVVHRYGKPCRPAPERANREGDQALPAAGSESVFAEVRRRIGEREALGVKRYGRSLETFNGRDAGRDLEDELLDGLAYATQMRMEHEAVVQALLVLARHVRMEPRYRVETEGVAAALALAAKLEEVRRGR